MKPIDSYFDPKSLTPEQRKTLENIRADAFNEGYREGTEALMRIAEATNDRIEQLNGDPVSMSDYVRH